MDSSNSTFPLGEKSYQRYDFVRSIKSKNINICSHVIETWVWHASDLNRFLFLLEIYVHRWLGLSDRNARAGFWHEPKILFSMSTMREMLMNCLWILAVAFAWPFFLHLNQNILGNNLSFEELIFGQRRVLSPVPVSISSLFGFASLNETEKNSVWRPMRCCTKTTEHN